MKKALLCCIFLALPAFAQAAFPAPESPPVVALDSRLSALAPGRRPPGRPYYWTCWSQDAWNRWFGAQSWSRAAAAQGSVNYCRSYNPVGPCYFMGCQAQ